MSQTNDLNKLLSNRDNCYVAAVVQQSVQQTASAQSTIQQQLQQQLQLQQQKLTDTLSMNNDIGKP